MMAKIYAIAATYWTADQFRTARKSMGLTRVQLAEHLDCALRTVERCEADGCRKVMAMAMERLAIEQFADNWQRVEDWLLAISASFDASIHSGESGPDMPPALSVPITWGPDKP